MANSLEHYGVKGMKWGVRKQKAASPKSKKRKSIPRSVKIGAAATATILATYGAYKLYDVSIPKTINVLETITRQEPYQAVVGYRHTNLGGRTQTWPVFETRMRDITETVNKTVKNPRRIIP